MRPEPNGGTRAGQRGFSLIEVLVTMTTLAVAATMGMPSLLNYMQRAKLEGAARQVAMMMYSTRLEAITRGAPAAVAIDEATGELYAFVDIDGATTSDPPDGIFNPKPGDAFRQGEILYDIETEKATLEVEAPCDGRLVEILVPAGETVEVGAEVCRIES